jgi:hypothetical protein
VGRPINKISASCSASGWVSHAQVTTSNPTIIKRNKCFITTSLWNSIYIYKRSNIMIKESTLKLRYKCLLMISYICNFKCYSNTWVKFTFSFSSSHGPSYLESIQSQGHINNNPKMWLWILYCKKTRAASSLVIKKTIKVDYSILLNSSQYPMDS